MTARFVPATDEVWRLHHLDDPECRFFQGFMNEGTYRDRQGHSTRQGIFAVAPSGVLLADVNTTDPGAMRAMLERAWRAWEALPKAERLLPDDPARRAGEIRRAETQFPEGGAALRVYVRDLPREDHASDWRATAWNLDHAWLRPDELRALLPPRVRKGATQPWPDALVRRLARCHLLDYVRGQTTAHAAEHVLEAALTTEVRRVKKGQAELAFTGRIRICSGDWPADGEPLDGSATRGVEVELLGRAVWDVKRDGFATFELVAAGRRWGRTEFNFRQDDLAPSPIGWVFTLSPPDERLAPSTLGAYGW